MEAAEAKAANEVIVGAAGRILSELDELTGVIEALEQEYIRLVRSEWLLAQPAGYRIERRQRLEEREENGESPLLSGQEAAALVRRADRSAGVLSHGWLSPGDVLPREENPGLCAPPSPLSCC